MATSPPSLMVQHLDYWVMDLSDNPAEKPKHWTVYLWRFFCRSKVLMVHSIAVVAVCVPDILMAASLQDMRSPMRILVGGYSCSGSSIPFAYRRKQLHRFFSQLRVVADALKEENCQDPAATAEMLRYAKSAASVKRVAHNMLLAIAVTVVASAILQWDTGLYCQHQAGLLHPFVGVLFMFFRCSNHIYAPLVFAHAIAILVSAMKCTTGILRALALELTARSGGAQDSGVLWQLHGQLVDSVVVFDAAMRDLYVHLTIALVALPLVCTVEVLLLRSADSFSISSFSVLIWFGMLNFSAQTMQDASQDLAWSCYEADWLNEPPAARRSRCLAMTLAQNKPPTITLRGLGTLSHASFLDVARSWFSFLQILINILPH